MTTTPQARPPLDAPAAAYPRDWIARHLDEERRTSSLLGEIREVVFGAQDGLVSTLAVVAIRGFSTSYSPIVSLIQRADSDSPQRKKSLSLGAANIALESRS